MADEKVLRVRITQPCVIAPVGHETTHAEEGDEVDLPLEDALSVVGSGRGVLAPKAGAKRARGGQPE